MGQVTGVVGGLTGGSTKSSLNIRQVENGWIINFTGQIWGEKIAKDEEEVMKIVKEFFDQISTISTPQI